MKIALKKDMAKERIVARAHLDNHFAIRIRAAIGLKGELYAVKYSAALAVSNGHASPLITSPAEADVVIQKNHEMQNRLASIEADRQAIQAEIDRAATAREIEAILERVASEEPL
ncbi:hypothetical protein [Brucella pituitosa]|uniref:hypothetical protein n=1 Tax=Brucella pituitosa TaxID=571256 RepID=UPI003F4AA2F6